jgi:hypothetical protein
MIEKITKPFFDWKKEKLELWHGFYVPEIAFCKNRRQS